MNETGERRLGLDGVGRSGLMLLFLGVVVAGTGCQRTLRIYQDDYINTAPVADRPRDAQTSVPLQLDLVVVYPDDLENPVNERLRPGAGITAKDWYERRPGSGKEHAFELPKEQVHVIGSDREWGRNLAPAIRGRVLDRSDPIVIKDLKIKWSHAGDHDSVLYIFPRFIDERGGVLPVPPVEVSPPNKHGSDLAIKVGVRPDVRQPEMAQYIEIHKP